jgi:hypothetical protein
MELYFPENELADTLLKRILLRCEICGECLHQKRGEHETTDGFLKNCRIIAASHTCPKAGKFFIAKNELI